MNAIDISNFSKSFGSTKVISNLDFSLEPGKILAFLGANGSGKTTTIRALLNIYPADTGELLVFGQPYSHNRSDLLGYLPEERGIYLDSTVLDTLTYFASLKGLSQLESKTRALTYLEEVGLADKVNLKIKKLSSGQQQKIQLGLCLIARPKLLILDEPTKGLDPINRQLFMEMFNRLNDQEGTSILFSTHIMEEAEKIADTLVMIHSGKRALYGNVQEVRKSFGSNLVTLEYQGKLPERFSSITKVKAKNSRLSGELNPDFTLNDLLSELIKAKVAVTSASQTTPSLEDIFVRVSNQN